MFEVRLECTTTLLLPFFMRSLVLHNHLALVIQPHLIRILTHTDLNEISFNRFVLSFCKCETAVTAAGVEWT